MSIIEPTTLVSGNFINWVRPYDSVFYVDKDGETQYLSSTDSTLTYILRNKDNRIEVTASSTDKDFEVLVNSTASEKWQPGLYYWAAVVTHTTLAVQRQWEIDRGSLVIKENFANAGVVEYDGRSHAKKVLDALEAAIEGRADKQTLDWISYSIAGRSRSIDSRELRVWYAQYKAMYQKEVDEERIAQGLPTTNRILIQL